MTKGINQTLLYVPNRNKGLSSFSGEAIASNEVYDIIKTEGIDFISKKIFDVINTKKELFGYFKPEFYGLHHIQYFFDLNTRNFFNVIELDSTSSNFKITLGDKFRGISRASEKEALDTIQRGDIFHWDRDLIL